MRRWGDTVFRVALGVIVVAIVYVLVRPGSPALQALTDIENALTGLIKTATS